jgi:hypothetical protein
VEAEGTDLETRRAGIGGGQEDAEENRNACVF